MNELIINNTTIVFEQNENGVFTDSRTIASVFGKEHKELMRSIKSNEMFNEFLEGGKITTTKYTTKQNKKANMYLLDRDAFSYYVMGFTGKEASRWKMDYIKAFNAMEKKLLNPNPIKELSPMELMALAYEKEAESHKKTQKLLEVEKGMTKVLEQELDTITDLDGLIDMRSFALIVTSKTNNIDLGRTKVYQILRACGLVGEDTRATQRGEISYMRTKLVEGLNGKMYPKTFVVAEKFDKLLSLMIRKVKEDKELNKHLNFPFGK